MTGAAPARVTGVDLTSGSTPPVPAAHLLRVIRNRWKWLLALVVTPALLALLLALVTPRRYEADLVALPRGPQDRGGLLNSLGGSLGGLAAIAGLSLGEGGERAEAIQMLQSQILARQFIEDNHLLPVLFSSEWDSRRQAWRGRPRTLNDAVMYFDRGIRTVVEDRRTGLVTVRITWRDPVQAAAWANELVRRANEELRRRAVVRAESAIDYIKREARNADAVEIQQTLYRLMEDQYKTLLLANVSNDYAFSIIDPAVPADRDQYVSPRKFLFTFAGLVFGILLAIVLVLLEAPQLPGQTSERGPAQ
jgi:uncharacterized protein involved in exopolysaccharide biosynthesis